MCSLREEKGKKVALLLLFGDQFLKVLSLKLGFGFLNSGVSFGLLASFSNFTLILFNLFLLVFLWRWGRFGGLWLLFAGGVSNLIDRLVWGGVVDYLVFPPLPAFNLADLAICLGLAFLLVDLLKSKTV